jgi:dolichyl-phosphate beta-glucosyltransferase
VVARLPLMSEAAGLAIVLPAYNEAERIGPALDELFLYLVSPEGTTLPRPIDVLVVDDGSSDATTALIAVRPEAAGALQGVTLRIHSVRHGGKGAAVRAGMLVADSDLIVFTDADMATPPDELPKLVAALADHDVALGSRIQRDGSDMRATQPVYRRMLGKAFHLLASIWVVGPIEDTQCGFKGFTRATAHDLFGQQHIQSIVFDVELIYLARRRGYRMAVVPIHWFDKRGSRMTPGPRLAMRVAWDLFRIPLLHRGVRRIARDTTRAG